MGIDGVGQAVHFPSKYGQKTRLSSEGGMNSTEIAWYARWVAGRTAWHSCWVTEIDAPLASGGSPLRIY